MHFQHLDNFLNKCVRKNDTFIPAMILFLIKNNGHGTLKQISRLIYIFDFRHELPYYDTIVEKFASVILEEYGIVEKRDGEYHLLTWPLTQEEIDKVTRKCVKVTNGFFSHINYEESKKVS